MLRSCAFLSVLSFLLVPAPIVAQDVGDWPQFRGHRVDGTASEHNVFRDGQTPALQTSWQQPLGSGYSGISVSGGLAVTMFTDGESNVLIAFDAETGRERWRFPFSPTYKGHDGSYDGPISTPVIDGNLTIALGPSGRFFAVDNLDGELVWSVDLVQDLDAPVPLYGYAASPLVLDETVILQVGSKAGTVSGFDPETGELRWTAGTDTVFAQTPIPITLNGRAQVLASGDTTLMGVDGASGEVLWSFPHGGNDAIGSWAMVPVAAGSNRLFLSYKDDSSAAVELNGTGTALSGRELWEARTIRNTYAVAVYQEGYVYSFSSRFLTCVDVATGKAAWKSRPPGDGFPILVDGHLILLTKNGSVHVAKATPEGYEEIASRQIFDDLAWTPPSFADGSLFVRSLGAIARIEMDAATDVTETGGAEANDEPGNDGPFAQFLMDVRASDDKAAVIDAFFEEQESFPIIEDERTVHFVYRGDAEDMAIGGDMIGARQERSMSRVEGIDLFYYSTELLPDARVSYVFVKDYQDALTDPLNPVTAQWDHIGKDMRVVPDGSGEPMDVSSLAMPQWEAPSHLAPPPPSAPRGRLAAHQLTSVAMDRSHTFEVYLPVGYDESNERYPVVYVHGGANAVLLGQLTNTLDNLMGTRLEPFIAVLIDIGAGSIFSPREPYGELWANELVPFIDENYRTIATREARANTGAGRSAHDAAHCAFRYPALSSKLAIQSIGIVEFGLEKLEPLITNPEEHPLRIHVEWNTYDLRNPQEAWDTRDMAQSIVALLEGRGYAVETYVSADGSGWPAWRSRNDAVLESLFPLSAAEDNQ